MSITQKDIINKIAETETPFTRNDLLNILIKEVKSKKKSGKKTRSSSRETEQVDKILYALKSAGLISKKKNRYTKKFPFKLEAELRITRSGSVKAETPDFDISIKNGNSSGAIDGDRAIVKITGVRGYSITGEIVSVFPGKQETFMASVSGKTENRIHYRIIDSKGKREAFSDRFAGEPDTGDLAEINLTGERHAVPFCSVLSSYNPDDESTDIQRIIIKHNLPGQHKENRSREEFIKASEKEADAPRKDYRDLFTVTIDDEKAKDFDDAISIKKESGGYILYVHIADVSAYVNKGTPLDLEAASRGNSYYIGGTVIPMLPEVLSNDLCSLRAGADRLTMSVAMKIDSNGVVTSSSFHRGVINVDKRLTYISAASLIKGIPVSKAARALKDMMKTASLINKQRIKAGRIDLNLGDAQIKYNSKGRVESIVYGERLPSHLLVEESMLCANEEVSRFIREKGVPSIYRVHEPISPESLTALSNFFRTMGVKLSSRKSTPEAIQKAVASVSGMDSERVINMAVLKSMMQAFYGTSPDGHFGLAFSDYTHFTSPIRRYPDLVVHRVLKSILDGKKHPYSEPALSGIAGRASETERFAQRAERDLFRIKSCRLLKERIGETFEAVVSGVSKYGFYVTLIEMPVEGMVPMRALTDDYYLVRDDEFTVTGRKHGRRFRLGDRINVRLLSADIYTMRIDFEPA